MYHAWEGRKMHARFWCENLKEGKTHWRPKGRW